MSDSPAPSGPAPAPSGDLVRPVTALPADTPVSVALAHLAGSPSGAVLATADGLPVGLLTEYRAADLALSGQLPDLLLGEACDTARLWAEPDEPYAETWRRMRSRGASHALVRGDRGAPIGLLTETTILRRIIDEQAEQLDAQRLRLEERVAQRTAELEGTLVELESFSYSLSHDLRAPLRAIHGFSRLVEADLGEALSTEGRDYLGRIHRAVERMDRLIDEMLDLARLSRKPLKRETVDVSWMARSILEELAGREPQREVHWHVEPAMRTDADPLLLHSVLDNLLGNAWKFTQGSAQACIHMRAERRGGQTVFVIEDNGAGFDMSYADRLFIPFQRLHSARDFEGSGVGLATVQRIVLRHGGRIEASAAEGQGAVFRFTLGDESV